MLNYAVIRPAILELIRSIITDVNVEWRDQARQVIDGTTLAEVTLHLTAPVSVGMTDSYSNDYDVTAPLGLEITQVVIGVREFTLEIMCTSLEQADALTSLTYLEHIRSGLQFSSSKERLRLVNCAIVNVHDVQDLSELVDDHQASIAQLDILIHASGQASDTGGRHGYIEDVELIPDLS